jgi:hypothetical protein
MKNTMMITSSSAAECELKELIQDTIVENAELTGYNMLIQMAVKMNVAADADADAADAIPSLKQNLDEEEKMFGWLRANTPAIFAKLWPQIEEESSSLISASSSSPSSPLSPQIMQYQQQEEDDEKFKGGSTTRHGGHLTVTTEAVSDRGNVSTTAADTVVQEKRSKEIQDHQRIREGPIIFEFFKSNLFCY